MTTRCLAAYVAMMLLSTTTSEAGVIYEFSSPADPTTFGSLELDIISSLPGTSWEPGDLLDFTFTIAGRTVSFGDARIERFGIQRPVTSVEAPFETITQQPGCPLGVRCGEGFNDFLTVTLTDDELFEVFRDLAVHCTTVPCAPGDAIRADVPIGWRIVGEPYAFLMILLGVSFLIVRAAVTVA